MQKPDSFVLKYGSNIDVKKRKSVIENFKQFYEENGGILFQEPGVEIDPITKKYVSEDIVASENLTRERVANVFQLPAVFLNANESSNFTKNEELNRFFLQHTLISIIKQYESEFNRKLLTPLDRKKNRYFKFNVKAYLRADSATQAEVYFKAVRSGYYTINEIRELEDLPPVENGDKPFISGDLYPIDTPLELRKSLKGGDRDDNEKVLSNQKKTDKKEIFIYGDIVSEEWFANEVTAPGFKQQLDELGNVSEIDVHINSSGGNVFEGHAIYNMLKMHKAKLISILMHWLHQSQV